MNIKAKRKIIGLVGEVSMPCGCSAVVAIGRAVHEDLRCKRAAYHRCEGWKQHKYELARLEADLAKKLKQYRNKQSKRGFIHA